MIYHLLIDFLENKPEISQNLKGKSCKIISETLVNKEKKPTYYIKTVSGYATACCFTSFE